MKSRIFLLTFSISFLTTLLSAQDNAKLERQINHLWEYSVKTFRSPRSGLFYGKALHELPPLKSYPTREQYRRGEYRTQGYKKGDEKTVGYNLHGGGSGCGCSAVVFTGYLMKQMEEKKIKRLLLMSTGALLSTISPMQGESIPGIAHAVSLEVD